ncbi:hypothetical protein PoB_002229000 [Plakobranchus ocellatus]|uniref:Uncharacterized protein n=1 Tax=Plakobranchus ocellatus TaxID=259542 RepID=A0AAV3ZML1_9GAST|nr:hypothetical protein PoB_002229000 [Plakobranchus ocellatus]
MVNLNWLVFGSECLCRLEDIHLQCLHDLGTRPAVLPDRRILMNFKACGANPGTFSASDRPPFSGSHGFMHLLCPMVRFELLRP